jgi:septal ring factor EnvC (AmiA/AmiB activator)
MMGKRKVKETSFEAQGTSEQQDSTNLILNAIENSLKVLTDKLDKQEETIKTLTQENSVLLNEVTRMKDNQAYFNNTIEYLKSEINELKQEKLNSDVIVTNIPTNFEVDPEDLISRIAEHCGTNKEEIAHHFGYIRNKQGGRGKYHNIIIRFNSSAAQEKFLTAKKNKGPLLYQQIFQPNNINNTNAEKEIYISERLTSFNLELLHEARRIQKKGSVKFAWHQRGCVLIKKAEGGAVIKIKYRDQLYQFDTQNEEQIN